METGGVEPNISMGYPHAEDGWQNKRKPQSNPSMPRCLGKIFSRDGLRFFRSLQAERLQRATPRENLIEHGADSRLSARTRFENAEVLKVGEKRQQHLRTYIRYVQLCHDQPELLDSP